MSPRHLLTVAISLFIFMTFSLSSFAQELTKGGLVANSQGHVRKWHSLPVTLCPQKGIEKKYLQAIKTALQIWNQSFAKPVFSLDCAKSPKEFQEDLNTHGIYWIKSDFSRFTDKTSLARTIRSYDEEKNQIVDADIVINAEFVDWAKTKADLVTVMVHELGHALGLKHNFIELDSAMNYFPYQSGILHRKLGEYEKKAIRFHYFNKGIGIADYLDVYLQNDFEKALNLLTADNSKDKEIIKTESDKNYSLGLLYKQLKQHDSALKFFRKSFDADPKNQIKANALADSYWSLQNIKEASQYFQKALELNLDNYEASVNLGSIFSNAGKSSEARAFFENALRVNPMHYISCFYLARITKEKKYLNCVETFSPDGELVSMLKAELSANTCKSCIVDDSVVVNEVVRLAQLPSKKILDELRGKGVCIRILDSGRKEPTKSFYWGSVEAPKGKLSEISQIKNLMGKTLCENEIEFSKDCITIALADDAPKSTLLHEYIHVEQIKKDPSWCELSKKLWRSTAVSQEERIEIHNREWDALKTLWLQRSQLKLATEDLVAISSEIIEEGKKRKGFDPEAQNFMAEQKIQDHFFKFMKDYKKQLGL